MNVEGKSLSGALENQQSMAEAVVKRFKAFLNKN